MDQEPLPRIGDDDPDDLDDADDRPLAPPGTVRCQECTILIGPGYLEREPWPHPSGQGGVCGACLDSLERRATREDVAAPATLPVENWASRHGKRSR
jgi:hypothetical protein